MSDGLYLNNILIDIGKSKVTRKIQVSDVGEIESWKSSFSYTIQIPKTSNNIHALEMLGVSGNSSRKPFELITCNYYVQGVALVQNGYAIIRETGKQYSLNIIDGLKSLSQILLNKKLSDLNLSALNHSLTAQTFVNSFVNTSGYIYALGNFGIANDFKIVSNSECKKFVTKVGDRAIPLEVINNPKGGGAINVQDTDSIGSIDGAFYKIISTTFEIKFNVKALIILYFKTLGTTIEINLKQYRGNVLYDNRLLFTDSGDEGDVISIDLDILETFTDIEINDYFILTITGNNFDFETTATTVNISSSAIISYKVERNAPSIFLHTIVTEIFAQNNITVEGSFFTTNTDYLNEVITASKGITVDSVGQTIAPIDYISDTNQIDIIKDLSNRFGLILLPENGVYKFISIEEILNDFGNAEDWTNKLSEINTEAYNNDYSKNNYAKFSYADGAEQLQDGNFIIDNENAENEKTLFQSVYEIPSVYGLIDVYNLYSIPIWSEENETVKNGSTPIKIMRFDKQDFNVNFQMLEIGTLVNVTTGIPVLSLNGIDLQNSIDTYYPKLNETIDNYHMLDALFNLSIIDIYNLDFSRLKFLKQTGRYYYLNSVQNTPNEQSKVELLRI